MSVLTIIDMQGCFAAANNIETITNVIDEIKLAKMQGNPVVLVEYHSPIKNSYSKTHKPILKEIGNYNDFILVHKHEDDGSTEVLEAIDRYGLEPHFSVCGVNTIACVAKTINGILNKRREATCNLLSRSVNCEYIGRDPKVVDKEYRNYLGDSNSKRFKIC